MHKKHIITISGKPGSGKSTTSKGLAKELQYEHFSSGDFFRAIGKERGIDVFAANLVAEKEQEIDHLVDEKLRLLGKEKDHLVIDSRMAWHWMPYSFRVYLDLDLDIAAKRIISSLDEARLIDEDIPDDPEKYAIRLQDRLDSEIRRYQKLYNANPYNPDNYDLTIDTSAYTAVEAQAKILNEYQKWSQGL